MKFKGTGFLPLLAILFFFHSAPCEKLVEVSVQITKLRFLPSASSDTRGFARQGQRFVVDGESGPWYRIKLYNSIVWISKDAVTVLESSNTPAPAAVDAAKPSVKPGTAPAQDPATASRSVRSSPDQPASTTAARTAPGADSASATTLVPPETTAVSSAIETAAQRSSAPPAKPIRSAHLPRQQKKETKPTPTQTWFSQFSRLPQVPSDETGHELGFFQISATDAPVFYWPETNASVLVQAKKGEFFVVRETTDVWCKIVVRDTAGWVLRAGGTITDKPSEKKFDELLLIIIIAAIIILVVIILLAIYLLRRKSRIPSPNANAFHALIISRSPPVIQCIISNKTLPLEKYLTAIGFSVKTAHDLQAAQRFVARTAVDIVFIDWNISDDIPGTVEVLFASHDTQHLPLSIFFNVPDLSAAPLIPVLLRAYHLGSSFTDHDISKLITPTILSKTSPKSTAGSALEGDIAEGNLPEILQFIEIGKKTGCLLIETSTPLGMIYFNQGRIIHAAAADNLQGRDAINSLLGLKQGHFRFLLDKQPKVSDLNLSTLEVLMEWTKAEDEAHRD
ncbi:MAG: DUF4388 domain-containing protein [Chitinispirillaceae bacterium]|nr:DUF4388 domain-containing protein [Chitinispirillaceae bacterium]